MMQILTNIARRKHKNNYTQKSECWSWGRAIREGEKARVHYIIKHIHDS